MAEKLETLGYEYMTPIQAQALPLILQKKDIIAKAKTGSGKTAAFGIGLLAALDVKKFRIQSLVLCPTRELAQQVSNELRTLAKFQHNVKVLTLIGGESFGKQLGSLAHHAHVVVGTPGRVLKHLDKGSLSLEDLDMFVLDEADRMLDMGFIEEIERIKAYLKAQPQTLLFSATYNDEVLEVSTRFQNKPIELSSEQFEEKNEIEEVFIQAEDKKETLLRVFAHYKPKNAIVFVNTKLESDELSLFLQKHHVDALSLHGDLEQYDRIDTLVQFSNESCRVLVATDVASRGIDIKELAMVVNYDMANTKEVYTHRIGRTARSGAKGLAVSLYQNDDELAEYPLYETLAQSDLQEDEDFSMNAPYRTLVIEGGKKQKLRAGDILGALTSDQVFDRDSVGKINIYDFQTYVAVKTSLISKAHKKLNNDKIKGKNFSVWILE